MTVPTAAKLLEMQRQIEEVKAQVEQSKGALQMLYKNLKERYDCSSVEEAKKLLSKLNRRRESLEQQIEDEVEKTKEKYPWLS